MVAVLEEAFEVFEECREDRDVKIYKLIKRVVKRVRIGFPYAKWQPKYYVGTPLKSRRTGLKTIVLSLGFDALPDRDTGKGRSFIKRDYHPLHTLSDEEKVIEACRDLLLWYANHEANEAFLFKKERIFDPHSKVFDLSKRKL